MVHKPEKFMKYVLLLTLCLSWPAAQAQKTDSLQRALQTMPEDTHRVLALQALYYAFFDADRQADMLAVAEEGLALSRRLQYDKGIDLFLFNKATAYDIMGKSREAITLFEEGMQYAQKAGDRKAVANYALNIGAAYYSMGDLDKALQQFLQAYELYKSLNLQKNLSKVLNNIGVIYRTQGKRDRAEAIYRESLAIKQILKDTLGMAASWQNLAAVLSTSNREAEMTEYLHKALAIYEKTGRSADAAGCYSLLGQIYMNLNRYDDARQVLQKARRQYEQKPSAEYSSNVYRMLGSLEAMDGNDAEAEKYLLEAAKWARLFGQQERLWDIQRELAKTQHQLGKYAAAYRSLEEAFEIRDSVTEKKRLALMEEMQTRFEVAEKDNELKLNQLNLNQRTLERNWLIAGAALLVFFSTLVFLGLRSRIRANKKIAAQESALQKQQIRQLEQENKLSVLRAMIEGQEQERSRIAADLHDGLGGLLTSVKSHFNSLPAAPEKTDLFGKTNRLIDDACGEVRRISHNMMPRALSVAGLPAALEDLAQDLKGTGIDCRLEMIGMDEPVPPALAVNVYRILQEVCNNTIKHAGADQLLLQLIRHDDTLTLIAEDNGKGFDLKKARAQNGLGLSSIESRVHYLQGQIEWDSVPGEGTQISITLPVGLV
jgi:signal transduction histidine kinase